MVGVSSGTAIGETHAVVEVNEFRARNQAGPIFKEICHSIICHVERYGQGDKEVKEV
jgi:hypothetical protein